MNYRNLFSCEKKVAIVTGGGGLLGREVVQGLLDASAIVYIADVKKEGIKDFLKNKYANYIYCDISSKESISNTINQIIKKNKKIDVLVNCAYPRTRDWGLKFEKVQLSSWEKNLNCHLGGYFLSCQLTAEQMKKQKSGSIINMASIYGITAPDFSIYAGTEMTMPAAYSAIKAGVISLTKYIATYYAKYNVRANVVSPGGIYDSQPESFVDQYSKKTPMGRMGNSSDIVGAVIYLASDASSYVTGHNLVVDGGWTAW